MVNFVSLSLLLDKNKSDGRYSVILFCPLVSFYLLFISKALFPETIKKSQPHSPSESVVYPENGGHATLSRSTLVSRNECKASWLYICRKITQPFILIRQKLKLSDTRKKKWPDVCPLLPKIAGQYSTSICQISALNKLYEI